MARGLAGYDAPYGLTACGVVHGPIAAIAATVVSAAATIGSTIVGMQGAQQQAAAARQSADYQAKQYQQQADESRAAAQRQALEKDRQAQLAQSQLVARAAASGAGATDETVIGLGENIAGRGEYEHLFNMYQGENQARGYEDAAKAAIFNGEVKAQAAKMQAKSTLISGIGSLAGTVASAAGGFKLPSAGSTFGAPSIAGSTDGALVGRKSVYG